MGTTPYMSPILCHATSSILASNYDNAMLSRLCSMTRPRGSGTRPRDSSCRYPSTSNLCVLKYGNLAAIEIAASENINVAELYLASARTARPWPQAAMTRPRGSGTRPRDNSCRCPSKTGFCHLICAYHVACRVGRIRPFACG